MQLLTAKETQTVCGGFCNCTEGEKNRSLGLLVASIFLIGQGPILVFIPDDPAEYGQYNIYAARWRIGVGIVFTLAGITSTLLTTLCWTTATQFKGCPE